MSVRRRLAAAMSGEQWRHRECGKPGRERESRGRLWRDGYTPRLPTAHQTLGRGGDWGRLMEPSRVPPRHLLPTAPAVRPNYPFPPPLAVPPPRHVRPPPLSHPLPPPPLAQPHSSQPPHSHSRRSIPRPWERLSEPVGEGQASPTKISVLTYNVLAQSLIEKNMHLYHDSEALLWDRRRELLLKELRDTRADEVDEGHYHTWFLPKLSRLGYRGLYKKRTGSHGDGCAIFYLQAQLQLLDCQRVEFQKGVGVLDRDNVAVLAKFRTPVGRRRRPAAFCLATTHLLYNPKAGEVKLAQLACLLAELDKMATPPLGKPRLPCILCGDLNSVPGSPLLEFVERGALDYSRLAREQIAGHHCRGSPRSVPIPIPLLSPELSIGQDCRYIPNSTEATPTQATPTEATPILSHQFKFSSAYPPPSPQSTGQPPSSVTTFHLKAFETVDYIHYTPLQQKLKGAGPEGAGFQLLSRRAMISSRRLRELGPQPHPLLPSDHLWLLASFQLIFPT